MPSQSAETASAITTRTRGKPSTTSSRAGIRARSTSTATTSAPDLASWTVREPSPGPISSTLASGPTAAISTMRRASAGSIRKCCPRDFRGRMPWRAANARISLGVSDPPGLPGDRDVRDALGERRDLGEGGVAEVDDPPRDAIGATVVDYHSDGLAVVEVGHGDHRPEWKAEVGRVVSVDPAEVVPGGLSDLRSVRTARRL